MRDDHRLDRRRIEVADGNHRHQVGAVPVGVELPQSGGADVLNDLRPADRRAVRIPRALQQDRHLRVAQARLGAQTEPPLFEDDAALLLDLGGLERHVVRPVLHDQQRTIDDGAVVGRNLELIDRLVEAGVGIDVRAEPHPERLDERGDVLPGKMLGAVEAICSTKCASPRWSSSSSTEPALTTSRSSARPRGTRVRPHEVLQAVRQPADPDLRIDGDDLGQRRLRRLLAAGAGWATAMRAAAATAVIVRSRQRVRVGMNPSGQTTGPDGFTEP